MPPKLRESLRTFEEICDPPDLDHLTALITKARDSLLAVEELDLDTEAEIMEHVTNTLVPLMKVCQVMKISVAPLVDAPPPPQPDVFESVKQKQAEYSRAIVPPGLQVIRNVLSEIDTDKPVAAGRAVLNPRLKAIKPVDVSAPRLINPYYLLQHPDSIKPSAVEQPPVHLSTGEAVQLKVSCGLWLDDLVRSHDLKATISSFCQTLLHFCSQLTRPNIFLSEAAKRVFGRSRFPVILMYYSVLIQALSVKTLWDEEMLLPLTFTSKRKAGEEQEPQLDEAACSPVALAWWRRVGSLDIFVEASLAWLATSNQPYNAMSTVRGAQAIPRDSLLLERRGIRHLTRHTDFTNPSAARDINTFVAIVSRSITVEGLVMAQENMHDSYLRLCFFHLSCMKAFEFVTRLPCLRATLRDSELKDQEGICLTHFLEMLLESNPNMELEKRARKHFTAMANSIGRCPGEGYLESEKNPWSVPDPVIVRDSVSVGERPLLTNMEFTPFMKLLRDPNLMLEKLPEDERDIRTFKALVCLMFLFLVDFHIEIYRNTRGGKNGGRGGHVASGSRFIESCLVIYPHVPREDAYGTVVVVFRQMFVYTQQGLVDTGNNLAVLITLVCQTLRDHSREFGKAASMLLKEMENEFAARNQYLARVEPELDIAPVSH